MKKGVLEVNSWRARCELRAVDLVMDWNEQPKRRTERSHHQPSSLNGEYNTLYNMCIGSCKVVCVY